MQHTVVNCSLDPRERIHHIYYDTHARMLIIATNSSIYLVDIEKNKQIGKYSDILIDAHIRW